MAAPRRRPSHRTLSPELKAKVVAALGAISDHLRIGPGYGMTPEIDLRWRLGDALMPEDNYRMPYGHNVVRALAGHLASYLGKGYNESTIFQALRLRAAYSSRAAIPRFVTWTDLRELIATRSPSRRTPKQRIELRQPGLLELRGIVRRAIAIWHGDAWTERFCRHPAALLYRDGDIMLLVRIIMSASSFMPMVEIDDNAPTVIELLWSGRPAIRCLKRHRRHARINIKDLRSHILAP